jgi:hypothetical protein
MAFACPLQPLARVDPVEEFTIRLAGKHVKPVSPIEVNIAHFETAGPTNSYHNVVLILPKDAVWR